MCTGRPISSIGTFDVPDEGQQHHVQCCQSTGDYEDDSDDVWLDPGLKDEEEEIERLLHGVSNEGKVLSLQQLFLQ